MGRITDALRKAAKERAERLERTAEKEPAVPEVGKGEGAVDEGRREKVEPEAPLRQQPEAVAKVETPPAKLIPVEKKAETLSPNPYLVTQLSADSRMVEEYRQLCANLLSVNPKPSRSVVVTSAATGEGRTITSINLGLTFAQELGKAAIVVDCDLRKPKVSEYLGLKPDRDLLDFLEGKVSLGSVIYGTEIKNFFVLPARSSIPNSTKLIGSSRCRDMIRELESQFELTIIDTPPIVAVTDAGILAAETDGTVVVVRADRTKREVILRAQAALNEAQANVLGIVLTGVKYPIPEFIYRRL